MIRKHILNMAELSFLLTVKGVQLFPTQIILNTINHIFEQR